MPQQDGHKRRTLEQEEDPFQHNGPSPFVELGLASCFSFLRAASDAVDLTATANTLGYDVVGIADHNTLAGVGADAYGGQDRQGATVDRVAAGVDVRHGLLAYPRDRAAYARLSTLLSKGKMVDVEGGWQQKGETHLTLEMVAAQCEGVQLIVMPPARLEVFEAGLPRLVRALPGLRHVGAAYLYRGDDLARIGRLDRMARDHGLSILATNDVLYHAPQRRPLQDVMTCIRAGVTIAEAGFVLEANAERYLKPPSEMCRLFADWPHAIRATREVADACQFSLDDLKYEYPHEIEAEGRSAQEELEAVDVAGRGVAVS